MRILILTLTLLLSSCQRPVVEVEQPNSFVLTQSLVNVREEFNKIPEEDQELIYIQFAGSAKFIERSTTLRSSSDYVQILGRVQSDFGWDVEKYPDFTTAVSDYLTEQGFDNPRLLDSPEDKQWLINIFNNLTNAVKYE